MRYLFLFLALSFPAYADDYNPAQAAYEQDQAYKQQIQIDNMQRQVDQQRYQPQQSQPQPQVQYVPVYSNPNPSPNVYR